MINWQCSESKAFVRSDLDLWWMNLIYVAVLHLLPEKYIISAQAELFQNPSIKVTGFVSVCTEGSRLLEASCGVAYILKIVCLLICQAFYSAIQSFVMKK